MITTAALAGFQKPEETKAENRDEPRPEEAKQRLQLRTPPRLKVSFMFNFNRRYIADFDWVLFSLALAVAAFGVLEISSVPSRGCGAGSWWGLA